MREELKNCPFCDGKAKVKVCDGSGSFCTDVGTTRFMGREMSHCLILCEKCGVRTKAYLTRRGVYNAWQRRADRPTEKVCTGERCPMQVGYDVKNCKNKDCIYRTETEKGGGEQ